MNNQPSPLRLLRRDRILKFLCLHALFIGGASLAMDNKKQIDELCSAAMDGNVNQVKALLAAGVPVNAKNAYGNSVIQFAVMWRRWDICELLINSNAQIEAKNGYGQTILMKASRTSDEIARPLVNILIKLIKQRVTIILGLKKFHKVGYMKLIDKNVIELILYQLLTQEKQNLVKQLDWHPIGYSRDSILQKAINATKKQSHLP
jgi:ankyrin repeat protein